MGVASEQWGQKVAAVVVLRNDQTQSGRGGKKWGVMDMRRALKEKLANYKIPQELKVVEAIPKNAMGKSESPKFFLPSLPSSSFSFRLLSPFLLFYLFCFFFKGGSGLGWGMVWLWYG